jgi:hypothetical protein
LLLVVYPKVDARLRDTTPMWEVVFPRLDIIIAGQESHASRWMRSKLRNANKQRVSMR